MKNKKKIFIYCCDTAEYRGEGILANNFILFLRRIFKDNILVYTPKINVLNITTKINYKKINHSFFYKYFSPIFGIFKIWFYHLKGNKTAYINFLPLWNCLLFAFLPKKTILGPITGGVYQGEGYHFKTIIRKTLIYILYQISIFFIRIRNLKCIFSTKLLLLYLPDSIIKNSIFNFQISNFYFRKKEKKVIDILYYNRDHYTKNNSAILPILYKLKNNFNILIVGKQIKNFKNLGIISRNKMISILKKTKFIFSSPENQLSYFVLDGISCNVRIISSYIQNENFFKDRFVFLKKIDEANIKKILLIQDRMYDKKNYMRKIKENNQNILSFLKENYEY